MKSINVKLNIPCERQENFKRFLTEASRYKPLTPEQEKTATPEQLVKHNMLFAASVAKRFDMSGIDIMDILQEALIGMTIAAEKFNPNNGNKFISYAVFWMRQRINTFIYANKNNVKYPELINRAKYHIEKHNLQESEIEEIAKKLKLPNSYINHALNMKSHVSLDITDEDGDNIYQVKGTHNSDVLVNKLIQSEILTEMLKGLTDNEKKVIEYKYLRDFRIDNLVIAENMNYTHQYISLLEKTALKKIKHNYEKISRHEYIM